MIVNVPPSVLRSSVCCSALPASSSTLQSPPCSGFPRCGLPARSKPRRIPQHADIGIFADTRSGHRRYKHSPKPLRQARSRRLWAKAHDEARFRFLELVASGNLARISAMALMSTSLNVSEHGGGCSWLLPAVPKSPPSAGCFHLFRAHVTRENSSAPVLQRLRLPGLAASSDDTSSS